LKFTREDQERMHRLLDKNQNARLTKKEQQQLESYRRVVG
jgi:hypothetical protein